MGAPIECTNPNSHWFSITVSLPALPTLTCSSPLNALTRPFSIWTVSPMETIFIWAFQSGSLMDPVPSEIVEVDKPRGLFPYLEKTVLAIDFSTTFAFRLTLLTPKLTSFICMSIGVDFPVLLTVADSLHGRLSRSISGRCFTVSSVRCICVITF